MHPTKPAEKWIWTELLAFDSGQPDQGVAAYLKTAGFVPDVLCLLMCSPDIVLLHDGVAVDAELPGDYCSRDGHAGNEERPRQVWTRFQLKALIAGLHAAGSQVYLSQFTHYLHDKFHREYLSDHPEGKVVFTSRGRLPGLAILSRRDDGRLLQEFFSEQLVRVCDDYDFDGWHGPDGFGPYGPPLVECDCSDDMIEQWMSRGPANLPPCVIEPTHDEPALLKARMDWIWRHRRLEWIEFYTDRWADFWRTVATAMRAGGRRTFINSAWTRDPFEAIYRYGIDHRKIIDAGVDGIVVETVAGSLMLGCSDRDYHHDFLAMLMLYRAYVPEAKLIFLHPIKDVAEDWDLLRHVPTMLEREIHALANARHIDTSGTSVRSADGFLCCLGDGIAAAEWQWLAKRWELAFDETPARALGANLVCWEGAVRRFLTDYPSQRDPSTHRIAHLLMQSNAPIACTIGLDSLDRATGPLLVPNPHLLDAQQRARVLATGQQVVAIGPVFEDWPAPDFEIRDCIEPRALVCRVYGAAVNGDYKVPQAEQPDSFPSDPLAIAEPAGFRQELFYRPVSPGFLQACAALIQELTGTFTATRKETGFISEKESRIAVSMGELGAGHFRLAIKNSSFVYGRPIIDLHRTIKSIEVLTPFPVTKVKSEGTQFNLVVPQRGIVVVDVFTESTC